MLTLIFFACNNKEKQNPTDLPQEESSIIITELMPNKAEEAVDWIELYNPSAVPINLKGCILSDDGGDELKIDQTLIIPPNEYAVIASGVGDEQNLPAALSQPAFQFSKEQFSLSAESDQVILTCDGNLIDKVTYESYQPGPATNSRSWQLASNAMDTPLNDDIAKWCYCLLSD